MHAVKNDRLTKTNLDSESRVNNREKEKCENLEVKFNIHTNSSDVLLKWFDNRLDTTKNEVLEQAGTKIMAAIVEDTIEGLDVTTFSDEMKKFRSNDFSKSDPYGLELAWLQRDKTSLLLNKVKKYSFDERIIDKIKLYFPTYGILAVTCNVYFVLTGWEYGDAMVCKITEVGNCYSITEQGEPIIIINLSIITKLYGKDNNKLINEVISNLMLHELFHLVFDEYKKMSSYWECNRSTTKIGQLVELIQNEGIAHYLSNNQNKSLNENYNGTNDLKNYEREAFKQLEIAVKQLFDGSLGDKEKENVLMNADCGKYWNKFGAISGKFMAYHIEKRFGAQAIQESLLKGPYRFIELYKKVQAENEILPKLPAGVLKLLVDEH